MATAEVRTNMDSEDMSDALLETFQKWIQLVSWYREIRR
jgi:hypothetical protein